MILMQQVVNRISFLLGDADTLTAMPEQPPLMPYAPETLNFLSALSDHLRKDPEARSMKDVMTFAFWCRPAGLKEKKRNYEGNLTQRLGRGVSLHFAPSNIPTLFAYTLAAGLLGGDSCIVRLPSQSTPQEERICRALRLVCKTESPAFQSRIVLLRCGHEPEVIQFLTDLCDVRIIWGGDRSVMEIRKAALLPRSIDLPFADRGSVMVLDAEKILNEKNLEGLVQNFYIDTYLTDQNACSSPQILYWRGNPESIEPAQKRFWAEAQKLAAARYSLEAEVSVKKWETAFALAAVTPGAEISIGQNLAVRVKVPCLKPWMWDYAQAGGFFIEASGADLLPLLPVLGKHCQTICRAGVGAEEILDLLRTHHAGGGDRIVTPGHTLDFSMVWDGFDLIDMLSRRVVVS